MRLVGESSKSQTDELVIPLYGGKIMAKKVTAVVKLQLPAGKATPGPPVGSTLGPYGINIPGFTKEFNAKTTAQAGLIIPCVITI